MKNDAQKTQLYFLNNQNEKAKLKIHQMKIAGNVLEMSNVSLIWKLKANTYRKNRGINEW